jgi:hypothetical protein
MPNAKVIFWPALLSGFLAAPKSMKAGAFRIQHLLSLRWPISPSCSINRISAMGCDAALTIFG